MHICAAGTSSPRAPLAALALPHTQLARFPPAGQGGWTPLLLAADDGHADVVRQLLAARADSDASATLPVTQPLHP
jgi:ankyrin repeat protein